MNIYEALNKESSLKDRCAKLIDGGWKCSWYWGMCPEERHWTMDALKDCADKIDRIEKQLVLLKNIRRELEEICPFFYPEEARE